MPTSSVKGSAFSFGANLVFHSVVDFGARRVKSAAENTAIIVSALGAINTDGGGVLIVPQGIAHTFDQTSQFPVTPNYLAVLEWTGGTFKLWCNQIGDYELDGNTRVKFNLQVDGISKLYGQVALSVLRLTPLAAASIQIPSNVQKLQLRPAGTLATLTIVMPQNATEGSVVTISSSQILTALTISPYAGQSIVDAPTTLAAQGSVEFTFNQTASAGFAANTWYRTR